MFSPWPHFRDPRSPPESELTNADHYTLGPIALVSFIVLFHSKPLDAVHLPHLAVRYSSSTEKRTFIQEWLAGFSTVVSWVWRSGVITHFDFHVPATCHFEE